VDAAEDGTDADDGDADAAEDGATEPDDGADDGADAAADDGEAEGDVQHPLRARDRQGIIVPRTDTL
jgi:hypothetical protein